MYEPLQVSGPDYPARSDLASSETTRPHVAIGGHVVHAELGGDLLDVQLRQLHR
jgi:hypothetical protein